MNSTEDGGGNGRSGKRRL